MAKKVVLTADSSCDIGPELQEKYSVHFTPLHVIIGEKDFLDGVDIDSDRVYQLWNETKTLPKTSAVTVADYVSVFSSYVKQGFAVIHISLGSALSCTHQNAVLAASEFEDVHIIDSQSLSTGCGLIVCEVGERIAKGLSAEQIVREVSPMVLKTSASFILDDLEFLHAGGRCSSLTQLGANLMNIKPTIRVLNDKCGAMSVGKKFIGKFNKCVIKYVEQQLEGRSDVVLDRLFITHSGMSDPGIIDAVKARALALQPFKEVHITHSSCTISSHCGPDTIGVLFLTK
ncbi:MAG: DegV family protein [Clostridia bacterium]|nr:DegV family protein [Clostridia bacterium]